MALTRGSMLKASQACSMDMSIEPDDIEMEDTVTIVWELQ